MTDKKDYVAPETTFRAIVTEGILCLSGNISDYKQEDFEW